MKCETCSWWGKKSYDAAWEKYPSSHRYCKFLKSVDGMDFATSEYGDAEIVTAANFGCIFWKAIK